MTRLFGYILGALSGSAFIGSSVTLFYQLFIIAEEDKDSGYGEILALVVLILIFSFIIFYYVYQTGFGRTKLEKIQEELEIMKLRQEIQKIKSI